jgi:cellulose biosynthesis protein BcsQ
VRVQELVRSVKKRANPELKLLGIVPSRIVSHRNITDYYMEVSRKHFGDRLLKTVIKELNRFHVAASAGLPITIAQPSSTEADLFRSLAKEIDL